jgi:hypothetical protein
MADRPFQRTVYLVFENVKDWLSAFFSRRGAVVGVGVLAVAVAAVVILVVTRSSDTPESSTSSTAVASGQPTTTEPSQATCDEALLPVRNLIAASGNPPVVTEKLINDITAQANAMSRSCSPAQLKKFNDDVIQPLMATVPPPTTLPTGASAPPAVILPPGATGLPGPEGSPPPAGAPLTPTTVDISLPEG